LFLQPHHLQTMQRRAQESVWDERRIGLAWPVGLIESRISTDALENMLVRFDKLRAIMPSGQEVWFPETSDLPPLDIKKEFERSTQPFVVELGVPLWYPTRGNAIESGAAAGGGATDWRVKRLYRIAETPRPDENTGENAQPVLVRRVNARLLLPSDDRTDMETLPLVRVMHTTGKDGGKPGIDQSFVPPSMVLGGAPYLVDFLRRLSEKVEAERRNLAHHLSTGGFRFIEAGGLQFEQVFRLRTLNRFSGSLPSMIVAPNATPFSIYLQLRELLGELAALVPHRDRELFDVSPYDHLNPMPAFNDLNDRIRPLLQGTTPPSYLMAAFEPDDGMLVAQLSDEQIKLPTDYYLGVETRGGHEELVKLVEDGDAFKLGTRDRVRTRVYGVRLTWERHAPASLPPRAGLHYFRLDRSAGRMWEAVTQQPKKELALYWKDVATTEHQFALYMPVPASGGGAAGSGGR